MPLIEVVLPFEHITLHCRPAGHGPPSVPPSMPVPLELPAIPLLDPLDPPLLELPPPLDPLELVPPASLGAAHVPELHERPLSHAVPLQHGCPEAPHDCDPPSPASPLPAVVAD